MAVDSSKTGTSSRAENFREIFEEFLAARVNLQLVLDAMTALLDEDPEYRDAIQNALNAALEAGRLPEQTWERLSAELDHLISEDDPTEWSMDTPAPQFAGFEPDDEPLTPATPAAPAKPEPPVLTQPAAPEPPVLRAAAPQPAPAAPQPAPATPQSAGVDPTETQPSLNPQGQALEPGSLLNDRYVLVSKVVSGAMGDIYKALDRQRKEAGVADPWVAIKVINSEFAARPDALQALKNEVELCLRLDHPNVIRVFGMEKHNELSFITMEWVDGESLVDVLKRAGQKPLPESQAHRILDGVSAALEHVHAMDVIHADVKPGNVLLTRDGQPKLIDFGIARRTSGTHDGFDAAQLGARTPGFCSPEVLEGKPVTTADEVFSLALLVYRVMSGARAFGDSNALEAEIAGQRPARIAGLSDSRWLTLDRALAFRRAERTASVAEFRAEFFAPETEEIAEEIVLESHQPISATTELEPVVVAPATGAEMPGPAAITADDDATDINQSIDFDPEGEIQRPPLWRRPVVLAAAAAFTAAAIGLSLIMGGDTEPPAPVAGTQPERMQPPPAQMPAPTADELVMDAGLADETELREILVRAYMRPDVFSTDSGEQSDLVAVISESQTVAPPAIVASAPAPAPARVEPAPQKVDPAPPPPAAQREPVRAAAPEPEPEPAPAVARAPEPAPKVEPAPAPAPKPEPAPEPAPAPAPAAQDRGDPPTTESGSLMASTTAMALVRPEAAEPALPASAQQTGPPTPVREKPQPAPGEIGPLPPPGPGMVNLSELEFRRFAEPRYPRRLVAKRVEGWVAIEFLVNEKGETEDIRILDSDPPTLFNEEAITAVEKWRFKPYIVDGEPTATYSQVRLRFKN